MERRASPENNPHLIHYQYDPVRRFVSSINHHFRKNVEDENTDDVLDMEKMTDDEVDALLELYTLDSPSSRIKHNFTAVQKLLEGKTPLRVQQDLRGPSPDGIKSRIAKELGESLARIHHTDVQFSGIREMINILYPADNPAEALERAGSSLSLDDEIRNLFEEGKLSHHDASLLFHHFGYAKSTASPQFIEASYRSTFAKLSTLKTMRRVSPHDTVPHLPDARNYIRKMLEGRHSIDKLAELSRATYSREQVEALLAVGLRELLDQTFD